MDRGDVFMVDLEPTSGHEQRGMRPVLVISTKHFNKITRTPITLPITSGGNFARTAGFAVPLAGLETKTTGIVRCDQPRALDIVSSGGRKIETLPDAVVDEVIARFSSIIEG